MPTKSLFHEFSKAYRRTTDPVRREVLNEVSIHLTILADAAFCHEDSWDRTNAVQNVWELQRLIAKLA